MVISYKYLYLHVYEVFMGMNFKTDISQMEYVSHYL